MNTTYALRACVQVLLQQRRGVWHTVTDLCMATAADAARVRNVLHQLAADGTAHMATVAGIEHFGIGVEGVPPTFQTQHLPQPQRTIP